MTAAPVAPPKAIVTAAAVATVTPQMEALGTLPTRVCDVADEAAVADIAAAPGGSEVIVDGGLTRRMIYAD